MRWYVSRNGETVGPIDEKQVVEWIRRGMNDASVRDEQGGSWMQLRDSPFRNLVPSSAQAAPQSFGNRLLIAIGMGVVGVICGWLVLGELGATLGGLGAFVVGLVAGNVKLW